MALLIDPLAVRGQALLSRCSSACGCTVFFSLVLLSCALLSQNSSNEIVNFPPPTAEDAVQILCFCQTHQELPLAVNGSDIGRGWRRTGDH